MKKIIAILLVLIMAFSLFACAKDEAAKDSESPAQTASESPAAPAGSPDATPAASPEAPIDTTKPEGTGADHFNRDPYKIAYLCNTLTWAWNNSIDSTLKKLGEKLNYEYTSYACEFDFDAYINQIYVFSDMGYDGIIAGVDDTLAARTYEVCKEVDIMFVAESTAFMDENGLCIWPSVEQANYVNGVQCVEWLNDNYQNYWSDPIDPSKLGLLVLDFSTVSGITARTPGAVDSFKSLYPEAADNVFVGDLLVYGSTGFSMQGGNDMTTTTFANNQHIEKWFVVANVDDWATGATRATESLKMEDRVLVVSIQADAFLREMVAGYTGNVYVASSAISSTEFSIRMAECLVTVLEGLETPESIWPEWRDPGGQYPRYQVTGSMITRDTYQEYLTVDAAMLENYS